jgi:hypothetical protein
MMSKAKRKWDGVQFDENGEVDVELTVEARRCEQGEPTGYEPVPENPPPAPKWQAKTGLCSMGLNGIDHDVLECLIDAASKRKGLSFRSELFIAGWTQRPLRTVQRSIASLFRRRLIRIVRRPCKNGVRNFYLINWEPTFAAYRGIKWFERNWTTARRHADAKLTPSETFHGTAKQPPSKVAAPPR